jgi:hypothetical protein
VTFVQSDIFKRAVSSAGGFLSLAEGMQDGAEEIAADFHVPVFVVVV